MALSTYTVARPSSDASWEASLSGDSHLHGSLTAFRSRTNVASTLPVELLLEIFGHLAANSYKKWRKLHLDEDNEHLIQISERLSPIRPHAWVCILRVCRWWYKVAVGCPSLWCCIVATSFHAVDALLRLSATLPIHVACHICDVSSAYHRRIHALTLALTHRNRIECFEFRLTETSASAYPDVNWRTSVMYLPNLAAPLKSLNLIISHRASGRYGIPFRDWDLPHLASVSIQRHHHDYGSNSASAFVKRHMKHFTYVPQCSDWSTIADILAALQAMPLLETVTVSVHGHGEVLDWKHPVHLPRLRSLHVMGKAGDCASLVENLRFPHDVVPRIGFPPTLTIHA